MIRGLQIGELAALGTALLWTLSTLAWTVAGRRIGALAVTFHRLLITCVLLSLHGGLVRHQFLPTDADQRTWVILALSGLLGFFLSDVCGFKALLLIGPRLTLLVHSVSPPTAAIISWLFLGEVLTARHWAAMAITIAGIIWVVLERPEAPTPRGARTAAPRSGPAPRRNCGTRPGVGDGAVAHGDWRLRRRGCHVHSSTWRVTRLRDPDLDGPALGTDRRCCQNARAMTVVMGGTIVGPVLGVTLCMIALRHSPAGVVTTLVNTMPVLVLPFTIFLFGERVSLRGSRGSDLRRRRRPDVLERLTSGFRDFVISSISAP